MILLACAKVSFKTFNQEKTLKTWKVLLNDSNDDNDDADDYHHDKYDDDDGDDDDDDADGVVVVLLVLIARNNYFTPLRSRLSFAVVPLVVNIHENEHMHFATNRSHRITVSLQYECHSFSKGKGQGSAKKIKITLPTILHMPPMNGD